MWLLLLLAFLLIPSLSLAEGQSSPNFLFPSPIRVTPWGPGMSTARDLDGNSLTIIQRSPQQSFYHFEDSKGRISQGYIWNNMAPSSVLGDLYESPSTHISPPRSSDRWGGSDDIYGR